MLGWDVGTFEFLSDRILALDYHSHAKLKLRTGGSSGQISKTQCRGLAEGDGMYWDVAKKNGKNNVRLPVKHRYRSPVVFEFHVAGKRAAEAYAVIWLQHLVDNQTANVNIPIWKTKNGGPRLVQNYITEDNLPTDVPGLEDLTEVGRLQFRCQFKAGIDESHEEFVADNESRETYETWEACLAEGVRHRKATKELPAKTQELHDKSLTETRDVLKQADTDEKKKWLTKDGTDWSGAFGEDPKAYVDEHGRKRAEPGANKPLPHDPNNPSSDEDSDEEESTSDSDDLGITDANHGSPQSRRAYGQANGSTRSDTNGDGPVSQGQKDEVNKKTEKRKQRGLMQWKPMRNAVFAKDEAKFAMKKVKHRMTGGLGGREPGVETEAAG